MHGFLLTDKPEGITSFYCLKILRRLSGVRRIGFIGTLDPLATGLMIFVFGEATKLISYLEKSDKEYEVVIKLGAVSDTYDAKGAIEPVKNAGRPSRRQIEELLGKEFTGAREQVPPVYSAIQIGGRRAYDMARKGEKVVMKKRTVHFHEVRIKAYSWPKLKLKVHCGSGTYIRSLAHDLGRRLGCGGYVEKLRRTKIGAYGVRDAVPLNGLDAVNLRKHIVLPQVFLGDWKSVNLNDGDYEILAHGGFTEAPAAGEGSSLAGNVKADGICMPILAIYRGRCAGVLEKRGGKLKFAKKFNIV